MDGSRLASNYGGNAGQGKMAVCNEWHTSDLFPKSNGEADGADGRDIAAGHPSPSLEHRAAKQKLSVLENQSEIQLSNSY